MKAEDFVNVEELLGEHMLCGCGYDEGDIINDEYAWKEPYVRDGYLILDGVRYSVVTDPDDGYRSYFGGLIKEPIQPTDNIFPEPIKVVFERYEIEPTDILADAGEYGYRCIVDDSYSIVEFGTSYYDDYYPTSFFGYHPESLPFNKEDKDA